MIRTIDVRAGSPAFIAEPIQGVGGFITPPKEYFQIVAESSRNTAACSSATKCRPAGDAPAASGSESSSGACSRTSLPAPKSLGNGAPIGLTVARPEVADSVKGADHFDLRRQSGDGDAGQSGDRLSSTSTS